MAVAPSTFNSTTPLSTNKHLIRWVDKMADLAKPANIHWVDGSEEENEALCAQMVAAGTFIKLNDELWPGCYYARSDANDVARGGRSHLHLLSLKRERGSDKQLGQSVRDAQEAQIAV